MLSTIKKQDGKQADRQTKIIVITGVSSGIGEAFVKLSDKYAQQGDTIVGIGRRPGEVKERCLFITADLENEASIRPAISRIKKQFGRIDVLINNAGFGYKATVEDLSSAEARRQFEVNFFAPLSLIRLALPLMRPRSNGVIINISSVAATVSTPTLGYYAATKAAMDKISEVLEQEVADQGIHTCMLVPGAVKSSFGKNMVEAEAHTTRIYTDLYSQWGNRFKNYFASRATSEEVARSLWQLVYHPQRVLYVSNKDAVMCWLKRALPHAWFRWLFLHYFYKYDG